jgi:uncharacterized protein
MKVYNSVYNFCFPAGDVGVIYNSKTGATLKIEGSQSSQLEVLLTGEKKYFLEDQFEESLLATLIKNGFLVEENRNELLEIRELYWKARGETPLVLTLTTTMDCNLGCYYCYETRTNKKLEFSDIDSIINYLEKTLEKGSKRSLHVDWYGGEPLLNMEFLEKASYELQAFCKEREINYHASVISNGTVWPENLKDFTSDHKIRQVQVSFDGEKKRHNKIRRYRKGYDTDGGNNSYDKLIKLIDGLLDYVHVDIRFNIDNSSKNEIESFLDFAIKNNWFNRKFPAIFQPARVSSYSERSSFIDKTQLSLEEFDKIRETISNKLKGIGAIEESEVPDGYPFPKTHVCAALAHDSFVVGADKLIYRCGLQVGELHRAVGSLNPIDKKTYKDGQWWSEFDPTKMPTCSKCSFLPICFGGCPKKHLEGDQKALDEQSEYWRSNLEKKVLNYVSLDSNEVIPLTKSDQFREGYFEKPELIQVI